MKHSPMVPDSDESVPQWFKGVHRRNELGLFTSPEYVLALTRALRDLAHTDMDGMTAFIDAIAADPSKFDLSLDDVVAVAHDTYSELLRLEDDIPSSASERRHRVWELIDENHSELRRQALEHVGNDQSSPALFYLPDSEELRGLLDHFAADTGSADDRFRLFRIRRAVLPPTSDGTSTRQLLYILRDAGVDNGVWIDEVSGYFRHPVPHDDLDLFRDIAAEIELIAQPALEVIFRLVTLSGAIGAHDVTRRLLATHLPQMGQPLRPTPNLELGRISIAAYLAGAHGAARRLAQAQLTESPSPGWAAAGEDILALYVLSNTGDDDATRRDALIKAAEIARHGNVHPLFARVYLDAARVQQEAGRVADAAKYANYARWLYGTRNELTGHFWDPHPLVPFAQQIPFDPAELRSDPSSQT